MSTPTDDDRQAAREWLAKQNPTASDVFVSPRSLDLLAAGMAKGRAGERADDAEPAPYPDWWPDKVPLDDLCKVIERLNEERAAAESQLSAANRRIGELEDELALWKPLTPDEAQRAYDEAVAVPMSEERIAEIVQHATDPANTVDNKSTAAMAATIHRLTAERDAARAECERLRKAIEEATGEMWLMKRNGPSAVANVYDRLTAALAGR